MAETGVPDIAGVILAAGAGTRIGSPKALLRTADGEPWLARAATLLRAAGCDPVIAVLGARAAEAAPLAPSWAEVVVADRWADGMAESLRVGLAAAAETGAVAALITLVDLPDLPLVVALRVLGEDADASTLRQAVFDGRPGHPVLIGRAHWAAVSAEVTGDRGARTYLVAHDATEVECGDLFDGRDIDRA
ncbi:NTP transferase domain-containing protein [Lacisediminihabitans sp.]|uniref:nucleotidyltransferase family protein n=1 Tax=Lacisediminihabitans sp. TaxID=2787631 RepID=UPI00374CB6BE